MTLQQMRYLIAIAEYRSISAAAKKLFISQSSLSEALHEVERETGVKVFDRTNRGVEPTREGLELLGLVRRVVEQDDLLNDRYGLGSNPVPTDRLTVSSQRYAFVVEAFANLMNEKQDSPYSFVLRETDTEEILSDVRLARSDLGVLCITSLNEGIIRREIDRAGLLFQPVIEASPYVVVAEDHPLASMRRIPLPSLEAYPRIMFEQRDGASAFFSEDPLPDAPRKSVITVRDRGSLVSLLNLTGAYTIGTGIRTAGMDAGAVAIPLQTSEKMQIGCLANPRTAKTPLVTSFLAELAKVTQDAEPNRKR